MSLLQRHLFTTSCALGLIALGALVACGGGDPSAETTPRITVSSVKVFGDSLADSGTFGGVKATVQGPDSLLFFERTAAAYGKTLCNFYAFDGSTFIANPAPGCTSFAIGGGVINNLTPGDPRSIPLQMATYAAAASYGADDLVLIDGGGNDAAALVAAYLALGQGAPDAFVALTSSLLPADQVSAALAGGATAIATLGGAYMQALADKFADSITADVLGKGAQRVVLVNVPGIGNTPRFQFVLAGIEQASGAAARAQVDALVKTWVQAINARLASRFVSEPRVLVVDGYTTFEDEIAHPAQFGLTNVTTPACPAVGVGGDGLPTYSFPTCTAAALSAAPPTGATGTDGWKTYLFSDSFHPTPYGHQLVAQLIAKSLATRGWL
jgi:outer membrane lipase/esterase